MGLGGQTVNFKIGCWVALTWSLASTGVWGYTPGPKGPQVRTTNHNDPHLHLFVDDEEIESIENLERVVNRPKKYPTPVLVADRPWEGERAQAWGSVIVEPHGLLRIWYFAFNTERRKEELDRGGYCYAESRDGIHWQKPELGVVEFRGSKRNNLFYTCAPDGKNLVERSWPVAASVCRPWIQTASKSASSIISTV